MSWSRHLFIRIHCAKMCSVPRPEFLGQRVHRHHTPGPVQALVLQGQLLHVQEDGAAETKRKVK